MRRRRLSCAEGFTLLEILVVVGIIAVLVSIVIIAINPLKQLIMGYDGQRAMESNQTQKAITQYVIDKMDLPQKAKIREGEENAIEICGSDAPESDPTCAKLSDDLVTAFLGKMPIDPAAPCPNERTGYAVYLDKGFVQVKSLYKGKAPGQVTATCTVSSASSSAPASSASSSSEAPQPNVITALDTSGNVGNYIAVAVGSNGFPIIVHYDGSPPYATRMVRCGNVACTSGNALSNVDMDGGIAYFLSLAIGSDGKAIIAYEDSLSEQIMVATCSNASCTSATTRPVATIVNMGAMPQLVLPPDGLPVVAYSYIDTSGHMSVRVLRCGDATCTAVATNTQVDGESANVGNGLQMTLGSDGMPVLVYQDSTAGKLKLLKCGNLACTSGNVTGNILSSVAAVDVAVGSDGFPVIIAYVLGSPRLKFIKCGNLACSSFGVMDLGSPAASGGGSVSIAVPSGGTPAISYHSNVAPTSLRFIKCGNATCNSGNVSVTLDASGNVGQYNALLIGSDGLPFVAYRDQVDGDLKAIHCGSAACNP